MGAPSNGWAVDCTGCDAFEGPDFGLTEDEAIAVAGGHRELNPDHVVTVIDLMGGKS
jgi:hypothetical protein